MYEVVLLLLIRVKWYIIWTASLIFYRNLSGDDILDFFHLLFQQAVASSITNALKALDKQLNESLNKNKGEVTKIIECLGDSIPDFTGAGKHIKEQLKQVKDELLSDPSLSELGKTLWAST